MTVYLVNNNYKNMRNAHMSCLKMARLTCAFDCLLVPQISVAPGSAFYQPGCLPGSPMLSCQVEFPFFAKACNVVSDAHVMNSSL